LIVGLRAKGYGAALVFRLAERLAALALPYADADMMQPRLDEISRNVAEGAHAILLLDRADATRRASSTYPTTSRRSSCLPRPEPVENAWAVSPPKLALNGQRMVISKGAVG
jgi:hypothetical protein